MVRQQLQEPWKAKRSFKDSCICFKSSCAEQTKTMEALAEAEHYRDLYYHVAAAMD